MVRDIVVGHQHAVLDTDNDAAAGAVGGRRIEMEQNRFGHGVELVLLGLHIDTGAGRLF